MKTTLLYNGTVITGDRTGPGAVLIEGDRIAAVYHTEDPVMDADEAIDVEGKVIMAGGIDAHVHFR